MVYITGFFITVSPDTIAAVAQHCAEKDKVFSMVRGGGGGRGGRERGGGGEVKNCDGEWGWQGERAG